MLSATRHVATAGFDAVAIKPAEQAVTGHEQPPVETVVFDYEGDEHLPSAAVVASVAQTNNVVLTVPIRVDGFDPLGDDRRFEAYEPHVTFAFVAGNGAYLSDMERSRGIAPRLAAALERYPDAWVGTEGIERLAQATGATQYELLSRDTPRTLRALRAAGFQGDIAVYAPTVVTDDREQALEVLRPYLSRRATVREALGGSVPETIGRDGRARAVLEAAMDDYALVGSPTQLQSRLSTLRERGATTVVGYPAHLE